MNKASCLSARFQGSTSSKAKMEALVPSEGQTCRRAASCYHAKKAETAISQFIESRHRTVTIRCLHLMTLEHAVPEGLKFLFFRAPQRSSDTGTGHTSPPSGMTTRRLLYSSL